MDRTKELSKTEEKSPVVPMNPVVVELFKSQGIDAEEILADKSAIERAGMTVSQALDGVMELYAIAASKVLRQLLQSKNDKVRTENVWRLREEIKEKSLNGVGRYPSGVTFNLIMEKAEPREDVSRIVNATVLTEKPA